MVIGIWMLLWISNCWIGWGDCCIKFNWIGGYCFINCGNMLYNGWGGSIGLIGMSKGGFFNGEMICNWDLIWW